MYLCVRGIKFDSFYNFSIGLTVWSILFFIWWTHNVIITSWIYTVNPANVVTSIKQSPVLKGQISYGLNLFQEVTCPIRPLFLCFITGLTVFTFQVCFIQHKESNIHELVFFRKCLFTFNLTEIRFFIYLSYLI
jgi:hypothetical protein